MDFMTFKERVKEGKLDFHPGVVYGFEDPDAKPYFVDGFGWADAHSGPADVVISVEELDIDPEARWGYGPLKGEYVMPDRAAAAIASREAGEA